MIIITSKTISYMIITGKTMKIPRRTIVDHDPKTKGDNSDDLDGDPDYNNGNLAGQCHR